MRFVVSVVSGNNEEYVVKRADLRLLLPPWWDELEHDVPNGHIPLIREPTPPITNEPANYYQTSVSSPLQPINNRHFDDFCESDDDLRREDILFMSDAGKFNKQNQIFLKWDLYITTCNIILPLVIEYNSNIYNFLFFTVLYFVLYNKT